MSMTNPQALTTPAMGGDSKINLNDAILLVSLAYSAFDILYEWDNFYGCKAPIHWWLLISYGFVVVFRITHNLGQHQSGEGEDFLLNLRQQKTLPRLLVQLTWLLVLPFFTIWTGLGSFWLREVLNHTPECLPMGAHPWFIIFWQGLSYLWIIVHAMFGFIAMILERRIQRAEENVRQIEDEDTIERWGRMSDFPGYGALPWMQNSGLQPAEIEQLDSSRHCGEPAECSICLHEIVEKEMVRSLPGCRHTFHKSCIDLWLLRRADCPLCKSQVKISELTKSAV